MSDDVIEQLAAAAILHDHVKLFFSFNYLIELNDIWVSYLLEDFDFPSDSLDIFLIVNLVFFEDFDGNLFASQRVLA